MKKLTLVFGAIITMLVFMFNVQPSSESTNDNLSYVLAQNVAEAQTTNVKCKKVDDDEIYCNSGGTITFKCATAMMEGPSECGGSDDDETLDPGF